MIGILLAAGFSRRFGSADKLMQPLADGRPMAVVAAENLISAIPACVAVVRADNQELAELLKQAGLKVVFCSPHATTMADSLATAIRHAVQLHESADGFVIALADMPFIQPGTISAVSRELAAGAAIAAPVYHGKRGHPVGFCAKFSNALVQLSGDEGARSILQRHADEIRQVECNDAGILADIDTPADLALRLRS